MGSFYISSHSSTVRTFTLDKVDEGWHNLVNIWHKNAVLDKIEIHGAFLNPMPEAGGEYYGISGQPVILDGSGSSLIQSIPKNITAEINIIPTILYPTKTWVILIGRR